MLCNVIVFDVLMVTGPGSVSAGWIDTDPQSPWIHAPTGSGHTNERKKHPLMY